MASIRAKGLVMVDATAAGGGDAMHAAAAAAVPAVAADILIGRGASAATIEEQLQRLERIARERTRAVAVISASPLAIQRLAAWTGAVAGQDLQIMPIAGIAAGGTP
jgi:polysaccharide deacetylase 2 family uncharacterized protein YibQ